MTCKTLFENTKQAVAELSLDAEVEYITDIQKIIEMGYLKTPILTVNGNAVLVGGLPSVEEVKELLEGTE